MHHGAGQPAGDPEHAIDDRTPIYGNRVTLMQKQFILTPQVPGKHCCEVVINIRFAQLLPNYLFAEFSRTSFQSFVTYVRNARFCFEHVQEIKLNIW